MNDSEPIDYRFWKNRGIWPGDIGGYTFLPRAIETLENALYPEPLLAPIKVSSGADEEAAWKYERDEEEYEEKKNRRRSETIDHFISACRAGTLISAVRPKAGGNYRELETWFWYSELCRHWFQFCDVSLESPYETEDERVWSDAKQWLFVKTDNLTLYVTPKGVPWSPQTLPPLSAYMQLMVSVIQDLNITPDNQPKLESLMEEFKKRWRPEHGEVSKRLLHGMASLVREPGSQAGRGKSKSNAASPKDVIKG